MPDRPPYPGVYIEENPASQRTITGVSTSITAFIGRTATGPSGTDEGGTIIKSFAEYEQMFGELSLNSSASYAVRDFFLNGGTSAVIVRLVEPSASTTPPSEAGEARLSAKTYIDDGIAALDKVDLFNLLCIPPDSFDPQASESDRDTDNEVYQALAVYCVKRRAMLILDSPVRWTESARRGAFSEIQPTDFGIEGEAGRNAAVYFPRVVEADSLNRSRPMVMPACGVIAGVFARTDNSKGVWKAPAGIDAGISGILQLEIALTDAQNGILNPIGINCLRSFPTIGHVIWGARTLRGADVFNDDYKYVPVRRLALFIEESIDRGTKWAVFEPNDETLWALIRQSVADFMYNLFRQGAFQGMTPDDAYFVKCDNSTTTPEDIEQGLLNILVGFAPLKPAEYVMIQIQQMGLRS
jgi:phage tail sheath protein FI